LPDPTTLRRLGQTDLMLTPLGLGCAQLSQGVGPTGFFWPAIPDAEVTAIAGAALEGGLNWFDTAEVYGGGASERALAQALEALGRDPAETFIATKWSPFLRWAGSLRRTIGDRLAALHVSRIDLHQVHQPFSFSSTRAVMNAMADLIDGGQVRYAGVSNFSAGTMRQAHEALAARGYPLASNQVRFGLLDRRIEHNGVLAMARELGMSIIAYSPLGQGMLTGKYHDNPELIARKGWIFKTFSGYKKNLERSRPIVAKLKEIADRHDATPAQVALSWTVNFHGDTVVAIVGASKRRQAEETAAALSLHLTSEEMAALDEVSAEN
jgi:aryl-alcohol dehydrogenase-like predicted oxidoreductase